MRVLVANPPAEIVRDGWSRILVRAGTRWPFAYFQRSRRRGLYYAPFPFFLAHSAALLRREGHEVLGLDCLPIRLGPEEFSRRAREFRPELILLEPSAPSWAGDLETAAALKRATGSLIVFAGPHATALGREVLEGAPVVDFVLRGEYEHSAAALAAVLERGGQVRGSGIPGLGGRDAQGVYLEPGLGLVENPDELPPPARDLFPLPGGEGLERYRDNIAPERFCLQVTSSRGCPRGCSFCLWNQVLCPGAPRRTRSPELVLEELQRELTRFCPDSFYFDDDSFTADPEAAAGICRAILASGLKIRWYAMADLEGLSGELLELMAASGCRGIKFGLESAEAAVLAPEGKLPEAQKAFRLVRLARRLGVRTHATFCLGLPGETRESLAATAALAGKIPADSLQCSLCVPYPGTGLYRRMEAAGRLLSRDLSGYDGSRCLISHPGLSPAEVESARRALISGWLFRRLREPRWLLAQAGYLNRRRRALGRSGAWDWLLTAADVHLGGRG